MELRAYAESIVEATTLAGKLRPPPDPCSDDNPGEPFRYTSPKRPANLPIAAARDIKKVPPIKGMQDKSQRRRILHALANHELQAAELFAWALIAFPEQPASFRRGLLQILVEEQQHCQLYIDCLERLGGNMGDEGVTGHFWSRISDVQSPMDFLCLMGLTFENANLDFAGAYSKAAREVGDEFMAKAIDQVHSDEIRHVAFAWRWLQRWKKPEDSAWSTYLQGIHYPITPSRARGAVLDRESRVLAGLDEDFISELERAVPTRPNGRKREE